MRINQLVRFDLYYTCSNSNELSFTQISYISGDYFIRIRAIGPCIGRTVEQFAILSYASSSVPNIDLSMSSRDLPDYDNTYPMGIVSSTHQRIYE